MATFANECTCCGTRGGARRTSNPSTSPPPISGRCPNSQDGKHKPKWVQIS